MTITYKDAQGVEGMRVACKLASEVLDYITPFINTEVSSHASHICRTCYTQP